MIIPLFKRANPQIGQHSEIRQNSPAGNSLAEVVAKENVSLGHGALLSHDLCCLYVVFCKSKGMTSETRERRKILPERESTRIQGDRGTSGNKAHGVNVLMVSQKPLENRCILITRSIAPRAR